MGMPLETTYGIAFPHRDGAARILAKPTTAQPKVRMVQSILGVPTTESRTMDHSSSSVYNIAK